MNQETTFPDQGGPSASWLEHDTFRDLLNFEIAPGMETQSIPQRLRQDHATGLIHFQCHTI
jgi:hypothetical protein